MWLCSMIYNRVGGFIINRFLQLPSFIFWAALMALPVSIFEA